MKKILIFESVKGAGKTVLIDALSRRLKNCAIYSEEATLDPIRHISDHTEHVWHYKKIIQSIKDSPCEYFLLDRFHYTKWQKDEYDKEYFRDIEAELCEAGEAILIFLTINENAMLSRLEKTWHYRRASGWKYNADGAPLEAEADRDIAYQRFFLEHQYADTILKKYTLDVTALEYDKNIIEAYVERIRSVI
mgnify:CR=1 FL=1